MAADALGLHVPTVGELLDGVSWPDAAVTVGVVETAGGVRSPQAADGDVVNVARVLRPDAVVLVADAGLGTINAVRLSLGALAGPTVPVVVLNRFDPGSDLHRRNRDWLRHRDGACVVEATPAALGALADRLVAGNPGRPG
jgi:dethiobiotin synthetase